MQKEKNNFLFLITFFFINVYYLGFSSNKDFLVSEMDNYQEIVEELDNLTSYNNNLKAELNKWKKRFLNIINFIKNRLLRPKDKDKYKKFTIDLYEHNAIGQETFDDIRNNYSKDKRKDDFER